jgi:hypothetical protein
MTAGVKIRYFLTVMIILISTGVLAQTVPVGIHYQAVARDDYGKELCEKEIDILFSIISGSPLGTVEYQELHARIRTSKYGVFSLVVGLGEPIGGTAPGFSQIAWEQSNHYLKVEVKFNNDFIDMGTIQFLAVPYALYARKSLEPGPQGPKGDPGPQGLKGDQGAKGDPGDPATDDQTLSFNGNNLTILGGNTVNLGSLNQYLSLKGDTLGISNGNFVMLTNQIQDLQLDVNNKLKITKNATASEIDLSPFKQDLSFNNATGLLNISNGTGADLSVLKTDEIQDLHLDGNQLTIDKTASPGVDLSKYLDDTDNQTLTYNPATYSLSISNGNSLAIGSLIAFRAKKLLSTTTSSLSDVTFIPSTVEYNDGNGFNPSTGDFVAPVGGLYTFNVSYYADGSGGSRKLSIYYNSAIYEDLAIEIASGTQITTRSITMKLNANDIVKLVIYTGTSTQTGTGSFSGFRVY